MNTNVGWAISAVVSVLLLAFIVYTVNTRLTYYDPNKEQLPDQSTVDRYLETHFKNSGYTGEKPLRIPTGLFVQSFEFQGVNDVLVTGYVWQRYDKSFHDKINKGIVFPDAVDQIDDSISLAYKSEDENAFVYGYYFEVTLRQNFDFREYPLDVQDIWLRLWHVDFANNIVLVPDLSSYKDTSLKATFGIDDEIVLGEWEIKETFFSYKTFRYDTDFGLKKSESTYVNYWPELHFNIALKREFHNAMFSHIIPLFIMALLSFFTLILLTSDRVLNKKWELSTSGVLNICGVLVFLVIIGHIDLRKTIVGDSVVYLEAYYLGSYFVIASVFLAAYIFSISDEQHFPRYYRSNAALAKMIFWPAIFAMVSVLNFIYLV